MKQWIACVLEKRGKRWFCERTLVWIVTSDWLRKKAPDWLERVARISESV